MKVVGFIGSYEVTRGEPAVSNGGPLWSACKSVQRDVWDDAYGPSPQPVLLMESVRLAFVIFSKACGRLQVSGTVRKVSIECRRRLYRYDHSGGRAANARLLYRWIWIVFERAFWLMLPAPETMERTGKVVCRWQYQWSVWRGSLISVNKRARVYAHIYLLVLFSIWK